jgi:hypothetical protein
MIELSRTWQRRLQRIGIIAAAATLVFLLCASAIGGTATAWHWRYPNRPAPIEPVARTTIERTDAVAAFAEHCIEKVLMATPTTVKNLGGCAPNDHSYTFATNSPATSMTLAWGARALEPKFEGTDGGTDFYAVQVQVNVRAYASATTALEFYSLPVAVSKGFSPQAVDKITRISQPPKSPTPTLGYNAQVKENSELHGLLTGFIAALLGDTDDDIKRYITADSTITPIGGYERDMIKPTSMSTSDNPPATPADGAILAAHVDVNATRSDRTRVDQLSFSLTLRCVGGTWFVTGIDAMPVVAPSSASDKGGNSR